MTTATSIGTFDDRTIDDTQPCARSDQSLIEQLQSQLIHNQLHRKQARDYTRILSEYNTPPAAWYRTSFIPRSIYVYDPRYQKTVHQSISSLQRTRSDLRVSDDTHICLLSITGHALLHLVHFLASTQPTGSTSTSFLPSDDATTTIHVGPM